MSSLPPPLVTICVPLHNYAHYVVETIRSIQAQTLNNIEVFIINDSSTDNSEEVALEAIKGDSRFQLFNVNFANLSATRNFGIEQGTAPFVACLDSDDKMGREDFLEILVTALEQDRDVGIAYTGITVMDAKGNLGHLNAWPKEYNVERQVARQNQIPSLCVFRRVVWERQGGYRPFFTHAEDAEFWLGCVGLGFKAKQITAEGLFHYRLHDKSASQVHRTGEIPEPDWTEFYPWTKDNQRPFAADGFPPFGSWPVRFYNKPEVSIIIPVGKGHESAVKDALHSVEGQTFRQWEAIVVNDSGSDLHLENGFPWAKVIETKGCIGAGAARNLGAKQSRASFLVFLDADDLLKPRFLEATLQAYRQNGRYAYTDWLTEEKQTNFQVHETPEYSFQAIWERPSVHPITTLLPRAWFEAVGGFDEQMSAFEDVDFYMKMLVHGFCGVRVGEPLLIYHLQSGFRRAAGEAIKDQFKALLTKRYSAYMEGKTMCNCVEPPKGLQRVAPTPENLTEYKDTYGEMFKVQLTWEDAAIGAVTFLGPATRVNYGRRSRNDVFYVWEKDVTQSEGVFTVLNDYETEAAPTVVPPAPELIDTEEVFVAPPAAVEPPLEKPVLVTEAPSRFEPLPEIQIHNAEGMTAKVSKPVNKTKKKSKVS